MDQRCLVVTADDYGIGPATSQAIRDLAHWGHVTGTVLLVTSPYAEHAVQAWRQTEVPLEIGWHPCLTLDRPIAPVGQVPSLVDAQGKFRPLAGFLPRLLTDRVRAAEIAIELRAQYGRFHDLLGHPPRVVNSHHHIQVFPPVGAILRGLLKECRLLPYLRRVREPWRTLAQVPGARRKRGLLSLLGRREARRQEQDRFPGNDWLAGITDPPWVADPQFLSRWLTKIPGKVVELTCHPGYMDSSLLGRDCAPGDGQLQRRVREFHLLQHPSFREACRRAGFALVAPSDLTKFSNQTVAHAA